MIRTGISYNIDLHPEILLLCAVELTEELLFCAHIPKFKYKSQEKLEEDFTKKL